MLYTLDEVGKILNLNPRTIRRYIEKGDLRAERIGGSWRVSEEALREMFKTPEAKEAYGQRIHEQSEDMMEKYLQGKHRLQQDGTAIMLVFIFDPQKEPWVLSKMNEWMSVLNKQGETAHFDFKMVGDDQNNYRLTLVAPPSVAQTMLAEWEQMKNREGNPV